MDNLLSTPHEWYARIQDHLPRYAPERQEMLKRLLPSPGSGVNDSIEALFDYNGHYARTAMFSLESYENALADCRERNIKVYPAPPDNVEDLIRIIIRKTRSKHNDLIEFVARVGAKGILLSDKCRKAPDHVAIAIHEQTEGKAPIPKQSWFQAHPYITIVGGIVITICLVTGLAGLYVSTEGTVNVPATELIGILNANIENFKHVPIIADSMEWKDYLGGNRSLPNLDRLRSLIPQALDYMPGTGWVVGVANQIRHLP